MRSELTCSRVTWVPADMRTSLVTAALVGALLVGTLLVGSGAWSVLVFAGAPAAEPAQDAVPSADTEPTLEERVEEILNTPAGDQADVAAVRCIHSWDYDRVEVLDDTHLVFHGRRDERWLNQLRMRCPGLRRRDTLQFEMRSMRLCEMDGFKSIEPGFGASSGYCSLGKFQPISPDQVQMIKDALAAQRDAKRKSPE